MTNEMKEKLKLAAAGLQDYLENMHISDEALNAVIELDEIIVEYLRILRETKSGDFFMTGLIMHQDRFQGFRHARDSGLWNSKK